MHEKRWLVLAGVFLIASFLFIDSATLKAIPKNLSDLPLVNKADLKYSGAFKIHNGYPDISRRIGFGGNALGYNSFRNSLFIGGHQWYRRLCEISIPSPVISSEYNDLPQADLLQNCTDITEGRLSDVADDANLAGSFVYNNRLIVSAFSYYDANCLQRLTHGASTLNFSVQGDFTGFFRFYNISSNLRSLAGYMTKIPEEWQQVFRGPALTGSGGGSIISCASEGPSLTVFNPDDIGVRNITGTTLLYYPVGSASDIYNWEAATSIKGIAFPNGTRSVLFIGSQGNLNDTCYGLPVNNKSLHKTYCNPDYPHVLCCYDPCGGGKGPKAYPYRIKIWAYDAIDILKVKNGTLNPYEVRPYAVWDLDDINKDNCSKARGATFDYYNNRIFIAPQFGEKPIIYVYKLNVSYANDLLHIFNPQPSETLPVGTTQTNISLNTNKQAICKYSTTPGLNYSEMQNTFSITNSTYHSQLISNLTEGTNYTFYVRCTDLNGTVNENDFLISFSVASNNSQQQNSSNCISNADTNSDSVVSMQELTIYINLWLSNADNSITISQVVEAIKEWKEGC